jgi:PhzF family phenazine biosynthesis protein
MNWCDNKTTENKLMNIPIFQVDAFASRVFSGNPAAVCILEKWLDDHLLQSIAAENNLSETAFVVKNADDFDLRWFTPATEVTLCGHATLASAFILFNIYQHPKESVHFHTRKRGELTVTAASDLLVMDFPAISVFNIGIEIPVLWTGSEFSSFAS